MRDLQALGTLFVLNASPSEQYNLYIKPDYKQTSKMGYMHERDLEDNGRWIGWLEDRLKDALLGRRKKSRKC